MKANIWAAVSAALLLLSFSMPDLAELLGREQSVQNQYEVSGVLPENLALWSFEQRLQYASLPVELIRLTSPETIKGKQHTAGEMEARGEDVSLADNAIHFALLSYAAGVASSRYVQLLRQQKEAESASQGKKAKKEHD